MNVKPRQNQWSVFSAARPGVAGVVETPIALTLAFSDSSIAFCLVELLPHHHKSHHGRGLGRHWIENSVLVHCCCCC